MKSGKIAITAAMLLALASQPVIAAGSVGYNYLTVPANSDVFLTAPFTQSDAGTFAVTGKTATGVTVTGPLSEGAFANKYYVRLINGNGKGLWSTISANGTTTIDFTDTDVINQVSVGDSLVVFPHETLSTVFPDGMEGVSFIKSSSLFSRGTQVLIPSKTAVGINKSAEATYFYYNKEWRKVGSSASLSFNDVILPPQEYFILRNANNGSELKIFTSGQVAALPVAQFLATEAQKNDIAAGNGFPVSVTLAELNLGGTSAFVSSTSLFSRKDELLVFDNASTGINKSAVATYFYYNGAWRKVGSSATVSFDDTVLTAGSAILIRKSAGTPGSATWLQPKPF